MALTPREIEALTYLQEGGIDTKSALGAIGMQSLTGPQQEGVDDVLARILRDRYSAYGFILVDNLQARLDGLTRDVSEGRPPTINR